jgi:hypothetical protein
MTTPAAGAPPAGPDRAPTLMTVLGELADCTTVADSYAYAYGVIATTCRGWHSGAVDDALGRIAAVVLVCDQKVEELLAGRRGEDDVR